MTTVRRSQSVSAETEHSICLTGEEYGVVGYVPPFASDGSVVSTDIKVVRPESRLVAVSGDLESTNS